MIVLNAVTMAGVFLVGSVIVVFGGLELGFYLYSGHP